MECEFKNLIRNQLRWVTFDNTRRWFNKKVARTFYHLCSHFLDTRIPLSTTTTASTTTTTTPRSTTKTTVPIIVIESSSEMVTEEESTTVEESTKKIIESGPPEDSTQLTTTVIPSITKECTQSQRTLLKGTIKPKRLSIGIKINQTINKNRKISVNIHLKTNSNK